MIPFLLTLLLLPCSPLQAVPTGVQVQKRALVPTAPDCNGNGIADALDIAKGLVADCNLDGIPDSCQLAQEWVYLHDDGIMDTALTAGTPFLAWLCQYAVVPGQETIREVRIAWGSLPAGSPATVAIWSDPDGDLDPSDAKLLVAVDVLSSEESAGKAVSIDVPDTPIGPPGTSFFVGVYGAFSPADFPIGCDTSLPSLKSWFVASQNPIDPDDLGAGSPLAFSVYNLGDWVVRAVSCPTGHCGEGADEDFDGVLDACQVQDCNGNGVPDDVDIALGTSQDCQGDGVPDECQLDTGLVYSLGSGVLDTAVGTDHDYYAWLNRFVVQPGGEVVTDVEVAWGSMTAGSEVTVGLWSDPNGDGDPTDAQLILGYPVLSSLEFSGIWVGVNIPDTFVGPAGTSFFLGAFGHFEYDASLPIPFAAGLDTSEPDGQSWFISANVPIDPDNLPASATEFGPLNTVCSCDGDWTIRAITCSTGHCGESKDIDANGEPDECQPDCNGNGLPDAYEIESGLETDCNGNGLPDSCEGLADCDGNGLPDLCQAITPAGLAGEYYATADLSGDPLARIDPWVVFDFGAAPPFPAPFPASDFSVRWTGSVRTQAAGTYTFGVLHDGGARLWVNGKLVVDAWHAGGGFDTGVVELAAFTEQALRLEWYQDGAGAQLELHWQSPGGVLQPMAPADLLPIYDRNADGVPDVCQMVDCNGNGVDDADDIASGNSLDNDGNGVPDECQRCDDCDANGWLDGYEPAAGPGLVGQYFNLAYDAPKFTVRQAVSIDPNVDVDWGLSAPPGVPGDTFGARWTGTLTTPALAGSYTFQVQAGDGVRLWLDGVLLIDQWQAGTGATWSATVPLAASSAHLLRLDTFDLGGAAEVHLRWIVPGGMLDPVPQSALRPDTDINGDGFPDLCDNDCDLDGLPDVLEADLDGNCVPDDCEGGTGYWRFEEAGGLTVLDDTPNGLDGTLNSYPERVDDVPVGVVPQTGAANQQALFNGWIGALRVPDQGGLLSVPGADFTLEAWVRLDVLGGPSQPNQRQWLFMKKPLPGSDALIEYALLVQAGELGTTGRELAFRYGDGTAVLNVISQLSIQDYEWHFVSLAYDAAWRELRFGLDGNFESVLLEKPPIGNDGPLLIGAHENQSSQVNQWLYGTYDEARFTRAFLPPEALLDHSP